MTIIMHSQPFVFVHLHKCGGTSVEQGFERLIDRSKGLERLATVDRALRSIERRLAPNAGDPAQEPPGFLRLPLIRARLRHVLRHNDLIISNPGGRLNTLFYRYTGVYKHSSVSVLETELGSDYWRRAEVAAIIRHPGVRLVSLYFFAVKLLREVASSIGESWAPGETVTPRLRQRVRYRFPDIWPVMRLTLEAPDFNGFVSASGSVETDALQSQWQQLASAGDPSVIGVGHLWRLEHPAAIEEETRRILQRPFDLPWTNESGNSSRFYNEEVLPSIRRRIEERYADDFERFGYAVNTAEEAA